MLTISHEHRRLFLLTFVKELIKNSNNDASLNLKNEAHQKRLNNKELIKRIHLLTQSKKDILTRIPIIKEEQLTKSILNKGTKMPEMAAQRMPPTLRKIPRRNTQEINNQRLTIPQIKLPSRFNYLRPLPTEKQLSLGKLSQFIANPLIKEIECNGPDTPIIVKNPVAKKTEVTLSKEEIDSILQEFSKAAMIPVAEGVVKMAAGKFTITAIVSEVVGSKFIIKRIPPQNMYR